MSKKQSSTPHDALFKLFLRQPETARDFLAFHLPAPIHALCDMKTLKLESSSFIDDDLRESYSDVLWSVKTEQGPGYIYCLIEHQSTSNKLIAFRMMRYAIAAMQNHLDAGYKTLPMVVLPRYLKPLSLFAVLAGLFRRSQPGKAALCLYISAD